MAENLRVFVSFICSVMAKDGNIKAQRYSSAAMYMYNYAHIFPNLKHKRLKSFYIKVIGI
jgi:hypothetical protein